MPGTAAVVVTYNRKELLARCLRAVLGQSTAVDRVFVIDNASTDHTAEYLQEAGLLNHPAVAYLRLPTNTGSAGGFHQGMRCAYDAGFEWLWLMDDDGCPAPDCLERLLACDGLDVVGPAVVRPDDPSRLTWALRKVHPNGRYAALRSTSEDYTALVRSTGGGVYRGFAALFNGVLIHRRVPERVGYVLADLFIWGDENEYLLRCKAAGFQVGICSQAIHYHPSVNLRISSAWKFYYLYRNTMYISGRYAGLLQPLLLRPLYPFYLTVRLLRESPVVTPGYVAKLLYAAWRAWHGELVPFQEAARTA